MPADFQPGTAGRVAPANFKPSIAELPPGHPLRQKAIDSLVKQSFTASPAKTAKIAGTLKSLNLSPGEIDYVKTSSAIRGNQAIAAKQHADIQDLKHNVVPTLAHIADVAATGGLVGDVSHGRLGSSAIDAATMLPILRPFKLARAGLEAGRAVKAADEGAKIVEGAKAAKGSLEAGKGLIGPALARRGYQPRMVSLGEYATQFPLSPSHVTAFAQRHLDRLSEGLVAPAARLSESENPLARAAGKVVTKASAQARVPIQAGKNLRQEARRAQALRSEEVHALSPSVLHGDKGSQLAHFWWAQMPSEYHNVEGLKLVRGKLAEERAGLAQKVAAERVGPSGTQSPALASAIAERDRIAAAHADALDAEAKWSKATKAGAQTVDLRTPLTADEAKARLAELDKRYQNFLDAAAPEVSPYGGKISRQEQLRRNFENSRVGRGNRVGAKRLATVKNEERRLAEERLHEIIAKNPDHPVAKMAQQFVDERQQLRDVLNRRAEAGIEGVAPPPLPRTGKPAEIPAASNPYRNRVVTVGHALEVAQAKVDRLAAAGNRSRKVTTGQTRAALADLRSADANLAKLDKVIAKPPTLQPHAIEAARTLMRDHAAALIAADKLTPETAKERAGLISRWLGLKPTGEEVYIGHRAAEQKGGILPRGGGLGKTKLPEGVGKQNTLYRVKTGRVRQTLHTAVEDWQRGQAYHFTTTAKNELAKMGEKIGPEGPKPGHLVVNPQGHKLPRTWKLDEAARTAAEGLSPEDATVHDLGEYARNTIAAGADRARLIAAAEQAGHAADLRQVPEDVARRYFAQFVPHKVVAGTVPGVVGAMSAGRKATDLAHDLVYASLIYSNPGYIPANTVANLVMAGMHQGAFLPVNLMRGGQAYFASGRKLRDLLSAEVGMGATKTAASQGRYPGSKIMDFAVGKVAGVPDNVPRISAFLHEAARAGVISKVSPILSGKDKQALMRLLTDPAQRPLLNDIRDRAVQAMVDFERLGAHEKAVAKRLFFVWAWTRGATRYPARFILDHPLRSVAAGYALAGAPGAPAEVQQKLHQYTPTVATGLPSWLQGALNAGHKTINGHTYPAVLPTGSISPASTPLQVYETAKNLVTGQGAGTVNNLANFLNPAIPAATEIAQGQNQFGQKVGAGKALEAQALGIAPAASLVRGLIHPKTGTLYPGDATRLGRLERATRIVPVAVDPAVAYKQRVREGTVSQTEKDAHQKTADLQKLHSQLTDLGAAVPPVWRKAAILAQEVSSDRAVAYAAAQRKLPKGTKLPARARYEITLQILKSRKMISPEAYTAGMANSKGWTDRQYEHWRDYAWRTFGFGDAGGPGAVLATVHKEHGKLPKVANVRTP